MSCGSLFWSFLANMTVGAVVEHECMGRVIVSSWFSVFSAYYEWAGWDGVTGVIRARGWNDVERDAVWVRWSAVPGRQWLQSHWCPCGDLPPFFDDYVDHQTALGA